MNTYKEMIVEALRRKGQQRGQRFIAYAGSTLEELFNSKIEKFSPPEGTDAKDIHEFASMFARELYDLIKQRY